MDRETKLILLDIQLKNVASLLGAEIVRQEVVTSSGDRKRRIIITYDHCAEFDESPH